MSKNIELLSPAGNLEKLKYACHYGANAVYLGLPSFSLRSNKKAMTWDDLEDGIKYAHAKNIKVYVTMNIFAKNHELERIPQYLGKLKDLNPDGIIVSDPGILQIVKENLPDVELHLSTQANVMNWASAKFWHSQGVKRVILARELNLKEIKLIKEKNPELDIEVFVHGAMCMSYSGRCLISSYLNKRDANHGDCTNACRWNYRLVEEQRPNIYYPVVEDENGTYFFNAKDLCLISYIPELVEAGVTSFKIEGRTKSVYYNSIITRAYRKAIDAYIENPENYDPLPFLQEVMTTSNRTFEAGFINNEKDSPNLQNYETGQPVQYYNFIGSIQTYDKERKIAYLEGRNHAELGETIEFVTKDNIISKKLDRIKIVEGEEANAIDPNKIYEIELDEIVDSYTLVRKRDLNISQEQMKDIINEQYIAFGNMKTLEK